MEISPSYFCIGYYPESGCMPLRSLQLKEEHLGKTTEAALNTLNQNPVCRFCQQSLKGSFAVFHLVDANPHDLHVFHAACTQLVKQGNQLSVQCPSCPLQAGNPIDIAKTQACEAIEKDDKKQLETILEQTQGFDDASLVSLLSQTVKTAIRKDRLNVVKDFIGPHQTPDIKFTIVFSACESAVTFKKMGALQFFLKHLSSSEYGFLNERKEFLILHSLLEAINTENEQAFDMLWSYALFLDPFARQLETEEIAYDAIKNKISKEVNKKNQAWILACAFIAAIKRGNLTRLQELMNFAKAHFAEQESIASILETISYIPVYRNRLDEIEIFYGPTTPINMLEAFLLAAEKGFKDIVTYFLAHDQFTKHRSQEKARIIGAALGCCLGKDQEIVSLLVQKIQDLNLDKPIVKEEALEVAADVDEIQPIKDQLDRLLST